MKRSKLIALLLVAFCLCGLLGACQRTGNITSSISPTSAMFVGGSSSDLSFTLTKDEDVTLTGLTENGTALPSDAWSVSGSVLTLSAAYLQTLPAGAHTFEAALSSDEVLSFTVTCYGQAVITPSEGLYDWDNPADVLFDLDLGGAELLSVSLGDLTLSSDEYGFEEGKLTIWENTVERLCGDGVNQGSIRTSVSSLSFSINCYRSVVSAVFDSVAYKMQSAADANVVFSFDAAGCNYSIERSIDGTWAAVGTDEVTVDEEANTLTVRGAALQEEYVGIMSYRVSVEDDGNSVFAFGVGTWGREGSAHPAMSSVEVMNNFDYLADGANFGGSNSAFDTPGVFYMGGAASTVISDETAIEGKSLAVASSYGTDVGWNILFGTRFGAQSGRVYRIAMDLKLTAASDAPNPMLAFRIWGGSETYANALTLEYQSDEDAFAVSETFSGDMDSRSSYSYDAVTGVLSVELYVPCTMTGQHFRLTLINGGRATVTLDNFSILATDLPVSETVAVEDTSYVQADGGNASVRVSASNMTPTEVKVGGQTVSGENWSYADGVLTLTEAFMQTLSSGFHELTLDFTYVHDIYGGTETTSASGELEVISEIVPHLGTAGTRTQTAERGALAWDLSAGSYTLSGVLLNGEALPESAWTYEEGVLTLTAEYLNTLPVGLCTFTARFTLDGARDFDVDLSAALYGTEEAHIESTVGLMNFADYEIGWRVGNQTESPNMHSWSNQPVVVEDSVFGRALLITNATSGALSLNQLKANTDYVIRLTFRTEGNAIISSLLWKWVAANIDSSWVENNAIKADTKDARTSLEYDEETGVWVWTSYLPRTTVENDQMILWAVTTQSLIIGSLEVFETTLGSQPRETYNLGDNSGGDVQWVNNLTVNVSDTAQDLTAVFFVNALESSGYVFRVMQGDVELEAGVDYVRSGYDGNADPLVLTAEYLSGLPAGQTTLTLQRACKTIEGDYVWQSATLILQIAG